MAKVHFNPGTSLDYMLERHVAGDWFDGAKSAMRAFSRCETFSPDKLLRETEQAIKLVTQRDILSGDAARLQSLRRLAECWLKQQKVVKAFRAACQACMAANVDPYELRQLFDDETRS